MMVESSLLDYLRRTFPGEPERGVLYADLAQALRTEISEGRLKVGDALPSERSLSEALGLSRETVRKAFDVLTTEGFLAKRHGARTTVSGRIEKPAASLNSFSEDMRARGMTPGTMWLLREIGPASPLEVMALGLSPTEQVCRLHRVRTGDGKPIAIEKAAVPARFIPDPSRITSSLYEYLERNGYRPVRALQRLRAAVATEEDARLLELDKGAPLLVAERRCFAQNGECVELTETRYCGTRYDFVAELRKGD